MPNMPKRKRKEATGGIGSALPNAFYPEDSEPSAFDIGGTVENPYNRQESDELKALQRVAAAERLIGVTERDARVKREAEAERVYGEEIGVGAGKGGGEGAVVGTAIAPGWGTLIGAASGTIRGASVGAWEAGQEHGPSKVEADIAKEVTASGANLEKARAEYELAEARKRKNPTISRTLLGLSGDRGPRAPKF